MARTIRLITVTGKTVSADLYLDGATSSAETVSFTEIAPQIYEGTVTAAAGSYTLNVKYSGVLVGSDRCILEATDPATYSANSVKANLSDATIGLTAASLASMWTTALTESYNADGAAPTPAQALFAILQVLTEFGISGSTMTVKRLDGSTTAFTLALNSSTLPTGVTRSG